MRKLLFGLASLLIAGSSFAQLGPLSVEKIMKNPQWMGTQPSAPEWSNDSKTLYFNWNPTSGPADSVYFISTTNLSPSQLSGKEVFEKNQISRITYNAARTAMVYQKNGDVVYEEIKTGKKIYITKTVEVELGAQFSFNDSRVVYIRNQNMYAWTIATGETEQLTNIRSSGASDAPAVFQGQRGGRGESGSSNANSQDNWLKNDQLQVFDILKERKDKREATDKYNRSFKTESLRSISIDDKFMSGLGISPDGRFVSYRLMKQAANQHSTIVPSYVTESGYTTDLNARTKVGGAQASFEFFIYDRVKDTVYNLKIDNIEGSKDLPDYLKDYPKELERKQKAATVRTLSSGSFSWSLKGGNCVLDVRASDNKDRWLLKWDTATATLSLLDRQRDEAWVAGPGIGFGANIGWIDDQIFWFQSEKTGYSHLYTYNFATKQTTALSSGNFEIQSALLSKDRKYFYITTNEVHPGEQHYYRLSIVDGKKEKLTTMTGANQVTLSPDEKWLAILYSYTNKPWELYLQENKPGAVAKQITNKAQSDLFKSYAWRDPEVISFPAADGKMVYARIYTPQNPHPNKPAVLFVHGAGYLQNAHKWWSSYFREYMFNNMLADNGYTVMDIDYRGSAGYGRDWRTGIYRHMGGKDLSDHVDAVSYLVKNYGVNPAHIGVYGGSYGGFISLMALFTEPNVFSAGAALRPVTDWAQYNYGYTANILNEPANDSIAYKRSSPLYFANGLKGDLLICHGMVDVNVHYQDAVKLAQRLIELGKDNWELASYPMEDHGFVEPSSWTDEYKRIFKLFERVLKK
ncbi:MULTISPECIES: alpha/beta fold hydrolase [unclassified Paraflavitalea]|uniref:S9 family peptidase n=1 Tax=unclassified Paraflavitalea TaxID=2798305 RepID=UPI003D33CC3D